MQNTPRSILVAGALATTVASGSAVAATTPHPSPGDSRIRVVTYNPNQVVEVEGKYGFSQTVAFAKNETVQNIAIGNSLAWQVAPNHSGNRIFLKPVERDAHTNVTVVTNKRSYNFELDASKHVPRSKITYAIRFRYPQALKKQLAKQAAQAHHRRQQEVVPGHSAPASQWNFNYSYKGSSDKAPIHVMDDGTFTYFEFRRGQDIPAIFLVKKGANESLVNYHRSGKYIVVERVGRQFTLRYGHNTVCIFNDDRTKGGPEKTSQHLSQTDIGDDGRGVPGHGH